MDRGKNCISPEDLYARPGCEAAPIIVDIRPDDDFACASMLLAGAFHRSPDTIEEWRTDLTSGRRVVTYCMHGRDVSRGVVATLRFMGVDVMPNGNESSARGTDHENPRARPIVTNRDNGTPDQGEANYA